MSGARPSEGSSISSNARVAHQRPRDASICCSPPESEPAPARRAPRAAETARTRSPGSRPRRSPFSRKPAVLLHAERLEDAPALWHEPTPLRAIASGASPAIASPNRRIAPLRGGRKPMMALMQVVLPAPFLPSSARTLPAPTRMRRHAARGCRRRAHRLPAT